MTEGVKVGVRVRVTIPGKAQLDGDGFILNELRQENGRRLFQVDMGDHDNRFPAEWLHGQVR